MIRHPVHDALVEIFATQIGIAGSRQDFKHAVVHFQNRNIKRAAAEIVNGDLLGFRLPETVCQRRRSGLVDNPFDVQARNPARILGRLSLGVIKVGGHGDNRICHGFSEKIFGRGLQTLQDNPGKFRRAVDATLDAHARIAVLRIDNLKGRGFSHSLPLGGIKLATNQTLNRVDSVGRIGHGLTLRNLSYQSLAFVGEADDAGRRASTFFIGDNLHRAAFQHRDTAVGGS